MARCAAWIVLAVAASLSQGQDGFTLLDPASEARLTLGGALQFRNTTSLRDDNEPAEDDFTTGYSFRRLRLRFGGRSPDGRVGFFIQTDFDDARQTGVLRDVHLTSELAEGLRIRAGLFRVAFDRDYAVSGFQLLTQDRSAVATAINPRPAGRVRGVELRATSGNTRGWLTMSDGTGGFLGEFNAPTDGSAITLRAEHAFGGSLTQFEGFTAPRGTPRALLIGAGLHAERREAGGDRWAWAADASYQHNGFNAALFAAGHVAEDLTLLADPLPEHAYAVAAHAGYYVTDRIEPFARYEWGATSGEGPGLSIAEVGANYYIAGQAARLSIDAAYAFEEVSDTFMRSADGLLRDVPGASGQVVFRITLQVLF